MKIQTKQEAEELAARYLSDLSVGSRKISVDVAVDRHEGDYWYVQVKPKQNVPDTVRYYEVLSKIETQILRETGEEVLFVPVAA